MKIKNPVVLRDNPKEGYLGFVRSIAYSPDGTLLAGGNDGGFIGLWNVATKEIITTIRCDYDAINSLSFSHDGQILAASSSGRIGRYTANISMWKPLTGRIVRNFMDIGVQVYQIAFSSDDKLLAFANNDFSIKIWDLENGQIFKRFAGYTESIYCLDFSPDNSLLVGAGENVIILWDVASGQEIRRFSSNLNVYGFVKFSPDGTVITAGYDNGTIKFWWVTDGQEIKTMFVGDDFTGFAAFTSDWKIVAISDKKRVLHFWDVESETQIASVLEDSAYSGQYKDMWRPTALTFSPDNQSLAAGITKDRIKIYHWRNNSIFTWLRKRL